MSPAQKLNLVSVEDYLAGELRSPIKHEYLGGVVYAMAGARNMHNVIATNIIGGLALPFAGPTLPALQLGHQDSHPIPDAFAVLLSGHLGDLPAKSADRLVSRRTDRTH
jgi:hypothetical protein